MKRNRVILISVLVFLLLLGPGGVGRLIKINMMIWGMNTKYRDDRFTYVGTAGGQLGISGSGFYVVQSENYPDKPIWVSYRGIGKFGCYDTYLSAKYEEETREYFHQLVKAAFGENCYVKYIYSADSAGFSNPGDARLSFEEYVKKPNFSLHFNALVSGLPEDEDIAIDRVKEVLSDLKIRCAIYFIDDPNIMIDKNVYSQVIADGEWAVSMNLAKSDAETYYQCEWAVGSLYKDDIKELVTQCLGQIFPVECFVKAKPMAFGRYSSIPTFEEYIVQPGNGAGFTAIVRYSPDDMEKIEELVGESFADVIVEGTIFFITDPVTALDEETLTKLRLMELRTVWVTINKTDLDINHFMWGEE